MPISYIFRIQCQKQCLQYPTIFHLCIKKIHGLHWGVYLFILIQIKKIKSWSPKVIILPHTWLLRNSSIQVHGSSSSTLWKWNPPFCQKSVRALRIMSVASHILLLLIHKTNMWKLLRVSHLLFVHKIKWSTLMPSSCHHCHPQQQHLHQ